MIDIRRRFLGNLANITIGPEAAEIMNKYAEAGLTELKAQAVLVASRRGDRVVVESHVEEALEITNRKREAGKFITVLVAITSIFTGVASTEFLNQVHDKDSTGIIASALVALLLATITVAMILRA